MCGIAGIINDRSELNKESIAPMLASLTHRGPETEGIWCSPEKNVVLGHRRLAIIDLSPGGAQPKISEDGKKIIVYNGELYNYLELKKELEQSGVVFKTQSDTEVLLKSYIKWGSDCLKHFNGMFAFAVWDLEKKRLFAARDRVGEKPFKYYYDDKKFVFASEVKAILEDKTIKKEIDWNAIDLALSLRFVPAPLTGFKNIHKLPAGHFLVWENGKVKIEKYWDAAQKEVRNIAVNEWRDKFWETFVDSVKRRLISDVPVGAFLSGGIDSTSVVAAIKEAGVKKITTFVVGDEKSEDRKYARIAADYFNSDHHVIELNDIDYGEMIEKLGYYYDEPFFDQSALPSLLINQHIKKYSTVALSGDGADELFGGYDSYRFSKFLKNYQRMPKVLYERVIPAIVSFSSSKKYQAEILSRDFFSAYSEYYSLWKGSLPYSHRYITKAELYKDHLKKIIDSHSLAKKFAEWFESGSEDVANNAMLADIRGRLPDGYLAKVDFAAMANAVEVRTPFLDHRLVEMSQQMPSELKIKNGKGKMIWREIVKNKIPRQVIERKKVGFALPLDKMLTSEMRNIVDAILDNKARIYDHFDHSTVVRMWKDHEEKRADYSNHIWSLIMLELWLKKYQEN